VKGRVTFLEKGEVTEFEFDIKPPMTAVQVEALVKKVHKVGKFALKQTQAGASNHKKRKKSRHIFY